MNKDYKYKFLMLKAEDKKDMELLKDALELLISKLTDDIKMYSTAKAYVRGNDIEILAKKINMLMNWRDNIDCVGSDTIYSARDLSEFENKLSRIY